MNKYLPLLFVVAAGCSTVQARQETLPRFGASLEATKALYVATCDPTPSALEQICASAKDGINWIIEFYQSANAGAVE